MTIASRLVVGPHDGPRFTLGMDSFVARAMSPDDHFSVVEYESAPGVPGPPLHVHHGNEECFFILEGRVDFTLDGETATLGPGSCVLVPKDRPHTFANTGEGPARWVGIFAPGRYQGLIEDLGAIMPTDGPPDAQRLEAVFARWDTELVRA
jgi:mannose-6-phosphate isomerase-like protein (cupin superfamily)